MRIAAAILFAPLFALAQASPEPPSPPAAPLAPAPPEAAAPAMPSTPVPPAPPPSSAVAAPLPSWSIGAGLSSSDYLFPFRSVTYLGSSFGMAYAGPTFLPVVTASLERRLGDRTWLSIGAAGSANRTRNDPSVAPPSLTRNDGAQMYVTAGVRRAVTAPAPVEVSLLVLGEGGYATSNQRWVGTIIAGQKQSAWVAGASLGLAVDRDLAPGLALRVATPLVGLSWTRTRTDVEGQRVLHGSDLAARLILAPRLELRLAF